MRHESQWLSFARNHPLGSVHGTSIGPCSCSCSTVDEAMQLFRNHQWSSFLELIIWTATGDAVSHPVIGWLCVIVCRLGTHAQYIGRPMTPEVLRLGFLRLRRFFREVGVGNIDGLGPWLLNEGIVDANVQAGHYLGPAAHKYIIDRACRLSTECGAVGSTIVAATILVQPTSSTIPFWNG